MLFRLNTSTITEFSFSPEPKKNNLDIGNFLQ